MTAACEVVSKSFSGARILRQDPTLHTFLFWFSPIPHAGHGEGAAKRHQLKRVSHPAILALELTDLPCKIDKTHRDAGPEVEHEQTDHLNDHELAHAVVDRADRPLGHDTFQIVRRHSDWWTEIGRLQIDGDHGAEPDHRVGLAHAEVQFLDNGDEQRQEHEHDHQPFEGPAQQEDDRHHQPEFSSVTQGYFEQEVCKDRGRSQLGKNRSEDVGCNCRHHHHTGRDGRAGNRTSYGRHGKFAVTRG